MAWIAYVVAWLAAAAFWSMAAVSSGAGSPGTALPYGLIAMGTAGTLGVAVWWLTGRTAWDWRSPRFWAMHAIAIVLYSVAYATSWIWLEITPRSTTSALEAILQSPVLTWNLLMGSWLYLVVTGLSYAVRAQRRLRAEENAAAEARLLAQQAQLAALRAQINPHFLFNALHSVGALVSSDPARADQALECLGDLLRYALGAEDEVPFHHEWQFTKDYLAFEQLRLGHRLEVVAHADDDTHGVLVPPLILQPLVENAVRHGIGDRPEGGRIELTARVERAQLLLSISDDGRTEGGGTNGGFGMQSVQRRLTALYGDRATFDVNRQPTGFSVTIAVPVRQVDDWGSAA